VIIIMNRRVVVSILALLLVFTMVLSLVLTVIPVSADGLEQEQPDYISAVSFSPDGN
jgi:hypothetical protein